MRVFLMMALIIPIFYKILKKGRFWITILLITALITGQCILVEKISLIHNKYINFILDETLLYCIGFCPVAVLGLKIREFKNVEIGVLFSICIIAIIFYLLSERASFTPQLYKYPPQFLYILYGLSGCMFMWLLKGILTGLSEAKIFVYISRNSMWLYLWHIIPVIAISQIMVFTQIVVTPYLWLGLYILVFSVAILLNILYSKIISLIPEKLGSEFVKYLK